MYQRVHLPEHHLLHASRTQVPGNPIFPHQINQRLVPDSRPEHHLLHVSQAIIILSNPGLVLMAHPVIVAAVIQGQVDIVEVEVIVEAVVPEGVEEEVEEGDNFILSKR
jgi:hypothetical protein